MILLASMNGTRGGGGGRGRGRGKGERSLNQQIIYLLQTPPPSPHSPYSPIFFPRNAKSVTLYLPSMRIGQGQSLAPCNDGSSRKRRDFSNAVLLGLEEGWRGRGEGKKSGGGSGETLAEGWIDKGGGIRIGKGGGRKGGG